ncbi:hypothetical protein CASFOL_025438 [Castilleja foliolosa]|uniref:Uncharacterized protein n=1 Tax=Castilleja foliolosa TaxID=1961234 RepID=A0ABD3CTF2_9LAMI
MDSMVKNGSFYVHSTQTRLFSFVLIIFLDIFFDIYCCFLG